MKMERHELVNYLSIVACLGINTMSLRETIEYYENEIKQLHVPGEYIPLNNYPFFAVVKNFLISSIKCFLVGLVVFFGLARILGSFNPSITDEEALPLVILFIITSFVLFIIIMRFSRGIRMTRYFLATNKANGNSHREFKKAEQKRLQDAPYLERDMRAAIDYYTDLLNRTEDALDEAHSLNVLYPTYRDADVICTMLEYFWAGSVDTLKEAINKYDQESRLDDIRAQLGDLNSAVDRIYNEMQHQLIVLEESRQLLQEQVELSQITAFNTSSLLLIEELRESRRR